MKCKNCGYELKYPVKFCPNCGNRVCNIDNHGLLHVDENAVAVVGSIFLLDEFLYYIHINEENGQNAELWRATKDGNCEQILIDFDKENICCETHFGTDKPMMYIDGNILFVAQIANTGEFHIYCFSIRSGTFRRLSDDINVCASLSVDGRYLYRIFDHEIQINTVAAVVNGQKYKNIRFDFPRIEDNKGNTLKPIIQNSVIYKGYCFISAYAEGDYYSVMLSLHNFSIYTVLPKGIRILDSSKNFFWDKYMFAQKTTFDKHECKCEYSLIDLGTGKEIWNCDRENITPYLINQYLFVHSKGPKSWVLNLQKMQKITVPSNSKVLVSPSLGYCTDKTGIYKYRCAEGTTSLYYLPITEWFTECPDDLDDGEPIKPFLVHSNACVNENLNWNVIGTLNSDDIVYSIENNRKSRRNFAKTHSEVLFVVDFYGDNYIVLNDSLVVGFRYGHIARYQGEENYYYNLYKYENGKISFLNIGSRSGIESLIIYNGFAYWENSGYICCDLAGGQIHEYSFENPDYDTIRKHFKELKEASKKIKNT